MAHGTEDEMLRQLKFLARLQEDPMMWVRAVAENDDGVLSTLSTEERRFLENLQLRRLSPKSRLQTLQSIREYEEFGR